jgi:hypothetical protein
LQKNKIEQSSLKKFIGARDAERVFVNYAEM